jgi:hypothetical protein
MFLSLRIDFEDLKVNYCSFFVERFFIGIEFIRQMGQILLNDGSTGTSQISICIYDDCCNILKAHLERFCVSQKFEFTSLLIALQQVLSGCYLIPRSYTFALSNNMAKNVVLPINSMYFKSFLHFIGRASDVITQQELSSNSAFAHFAKCLRLAIKILQREFIRPDEEIISYDELQELVVPFQTKSATKGVGSLSSRFASILLQKISINCIVNGEYLNATATTQLNVLLSAESDVVTRKWTESIALSMLSSDTYLPRIMPSDLYMNEAGSLEEIEFKACCLRFHALFSSNPDEVREAAEALELAAKEIWKIQHSSSRLVMYVYQWSKATLKLGLAEFYKKKNMLEEAVYMYCKCYSECLYLIKNMSKVESSVGDTKSTSREHDQYLLLESRCLERQKKCIIRLAVLFRRLGDHRKAWQYGKSLLKLMGANVNGLVVKPSLHTLLASLDSLGVKTHEKYNMGRFLVQLMAVATPRSMLLKDFEQLMENVASSVECRSIVTNPVYSLLDITNNLNTSTYRQIDLLRKEFL